VTCFTRDVDANVEVTVKEQKEVRFGRTIIPHSCNSLDHEQRHPAIDTCRSVMDLDEPEEKRRRLAHSTWE
jgi:hypothetical protein